MWRKVVKLIHSRLSITELFETTWTDNVPSECQEAWRSSSSGGSHRTLSTNRVCILLEPEIHQSLPRLKHVPNQTSTIFSCLNSTPVTSTLCVRRMEAHGASLFTSAHDTQGKDLLVIQSRQQELAHDKLSACDSLGWQPVGTASCYWPCLLFGRL